MGTNHVVMFSGGAGSWAAAKRVVELAGASNVTLLFADTCMEDEDLYRFIQDAQNNVGAKLVRVADGRTPWEVYRHERFLGNSRADPCSKLLKRKPCLDWLSQNCDPSETNVYVGVDWTEVHRYTRIQKRYKELGWRCIAPLCAKPLLSKDQIMKWMVSEGLAPPRLYGMGFDHNNCGGFCCKAGQGHFARLWKEMPDRYLWHEEQERQIRLHLDKDIAIMVDRRGGGVRRPLTMEEFRTRRLSIGEVQHDEVGGCGCFAGDLE